MTANSFAYNPALGKTPIDLPDELSVTRDFSVSAIKSLPTKANFGGSVKITDSPIKVWPNAIVEIKGDFVLKGTDVKTLPTNFSARGSVDLSDSRVSELPDAMKVGRNLNLSGSNVSKLPDDLIVEGTLNIANTRIKDLGISVQPRRITLDKAQFDGPDELFKPDKNDSSVTTITYNEYKRFPFIKYKGPVVEGEDEPEEDEKEFEIEEEPTEIEPDVEVDIPEVNIDDEEDEVDFDPDTKPSSVKKGKSVQDDEDEDEDEFEPEEVEIDYKEGDRVVINAGSDEEPEYYLVDITGKEDNEWLIEFDDGDTGTVDDINDIVGFAVKRKRKSSFDGGQLSKYLVED